VGLGIEVLLVSGILLSEIRGPLQVRAHELGTKRSINLSGTLLRTLGARHLPDIFTLSGYVLAAGHGLKNFLRSLSYDNTLC
jgi:hypothetical protein